MGIFNERLHGAFDVLLIAVLAAGPWLADFHGAPASLSVALAAVLLLQMLCTRFSLGAVKVIPFVAHGAVEAMVALLLVVTPWLAGFSHVMAARNFFCGMGALLGIIGLCTRYED